MTFLVKQGGADVNESELNGCQYFEIFVFFDKVWSKFKICFIIY